MLRLVQSKPFLYYVTDVINEKDNINIYYITSTTDESVKLAHDYMNFVGKDNYQFMVQVDGVVSLTFDNNSEITFLPKSEALVILDLPLTPHIFIENFDGCKELGETLKSKALGINIVDSKTKELL